jgi:hypothetical protein
MNLRSTLTVAAMAGACALLVSAADPSTAAEREPNSQLPPTTVVLGSFQCAGTGVAEVDAFVAEVHGPLADEIVAEGLWLDWAYLTHRYGDEFNRVVMYRAPDLETHLRASAEFSRRLALRYGGDTPFTRHCPVHKDNIYTQALP